MGDDRTPGEKATEAAIEVGVTAGSALLLSTAAPAPIALIGGRWIGKYVAEHLKRFRERREARVNAYVASLALGLGGEEAATPKLESPAADEVVMESIRSLLNAIDDAVVPMLAAMSKEYIERGHAADRFLRATSRMLADCDRDDIDALKRLFARATENETDDDDLRIRFVAKDREEEDMDTVVHDLIVGPEDEEERGRTDALNALIVRTPAPTNDNPDKLDDSLPVRIAEPLRILHLLNSHGVGRTEPQWGADGSSMRMVHVRRLARALAADG